MGKYKYKTKPYPHQRSALKRAVRQGYIALLWDPGVMKSKVVVDWACYLFSKKKLERVLILCPLSVIGVWEDEWKDHAPMPYNFYVMHRKGIRRIGKKIEGALTVLVANYDIAWRRDEVLIGLEPDMVVVDESHLIKRPGARRSKFTHRKGIDNASYRAILTGTVTPRSYLDVYSQWRFLNKKRFGTNFQDYKDEYIIMGGYMNRTVKGYRNPDKLKKLIQMDASIRRKDQTLDLPKTTMQRIPVELEDEVWKIYAKLANELFLEIKGGTVDIKNAAVKILRLQQLVGGFLKTDDGKVHQVSSAKLEVQAERLENLYNADERVVTFCRFLPELHAIEKLRVNKQVPVYVVYGKVKQRDRDIMRRKFQKQKGPSLFLCQIATGSLGIPLYKSHDALFYSLSYQLDHHIQACGRLDRKGQTKPVRFEHLLARATVDYDIYSNLKGKRDVLEFIMGKPEALVRRLSH